MRQHPGHTNTKSDEYRESYYHGHALTEPNSFGYTDRVRLIKHTHTYDKSKPHTHDARDPYPGHGPDFTPSR